MRVNDDFVSMSDSLTRTEIEIVNDGLAKYYAFLGVEYDDNFKEYCQDQGIDDLTDELVDIDDCTLLEFDDDFPFSNPQPVDEDDKNCRMFKILKRCQNPDVVFDVALPQCCVLSS